MITEHIPLLLHNKLDSINQVVTILSLVLTA